MPKSVASWSAYIILWNNVDYTLTLSASLLTDNCRLYPFVIMKESSFHLKYAWVAQNYLRDHHRTWTLISKRDSLNYLDRLSTLHRHAWNFIMQDDVSAITENVVLLRDASPVNHDCMDDDSHNDWDNNQWIGQCSVSEMLTALPVPVMMNI